MKKILSLLLVTFFSAACAEAGIPENYYKDADGLTSLALKTALEDIISEHATISYSNLWDYYPYTYYHTENEDQIYDMYSDVVSYFSDYSGLNKEHVVPKSWWGGSTASGPGCDLYNVIPGEAKANNAKGNYSLGVVATATYTNGVIKVGPADASLYSYSGTVFEPADADKGDFARIYLYVAACYPDMDWDANDKDGSQSMTNSSELTLKDWIIPMLLDWNEADPVDEAEIQRNEDVSKYQGNRNPFIDYPELADYIWGEKSGEAFLLAGHTANEGQSNDNMKTKAPTFSVDYGTEDAPKVVGNGTEVTVKGGATYATLYTRVNGGEWEQSDYTTGWSSSSSSYGINASKTIEINGPTLIEAYCTLEGYANSNTVSAYYTGTDLSADYLLYEAFDDLTSGNNTSTSGSSTQWGGNDNFPEVSYCYQAGNAVRLGKSKQNGSMTSRTLDTDGGKLTVEFDVKGWSSVEGDLLAGFSASDGGDYDESRTVTYSATITDSFEHVSLTFEDVCARPVFTIATTADRAFVDNVVVYAEKDGDENGEATAIAKTEAQGEKSGACYNLSGQRVGKDYKGIVVSGGRKIMRKQ